MSILTTLLGGGVGELFAKIVGTFKLSPEVQAELAAKLKEHEFELARLDADLDAKLAAAAGDTLRTEIASGSWLGKNWRPFFGFGMGTALIANIIIPLISALTGRVVPMLTIPSEYFLLYGFGFLGYGGLRTFEKIMEARFDLLKR